MPAQNVLFIAVDDLLDFVANRDAFGVSIQTPNLDALMAQSAVFSNAFSTIPVCGPSRGALMTGQSAFETHVHTNENEWYDGMDPSGAIPAIMKDAGYHTATAGKIFHGYTPEPGYVNDRLYSETPPTIWDTQSGPSTPNGGIWGAEGYVGQDDQFYDHKVADYGIDFLNTYTSPDPFMLLLGFKHPHSGYQMPQQYYDMYDKDQIKIPDHWDLDDLNDVPAWVANSFSSGMFDLDTDFDTWQASIEAYLAAITHMDHQVGRVMDALENSDHATDTSIVLFSDHGYHLGDKDHFTKFTLWEEGAKAPLMIYNPDNPVGTVVDTPVSFMDIAPTVLDMGGLAPTSDMVGQSLMGFADPDAPAYVEDAVLTHIWGNASIRLGDDRYTLYSDGSEELYNMADDPGQITNLADDPNHAALMDQMRATLAAKLDDYGVTLDSDAALITGTSGDDAAIADGANTEIALGDGDDAYYIHDGEVTVTEGVNAGDDTVYFTTQDSFTLPDNVEVAITGAPRTPDEITVMGNDADNTITTFSGGAEVHGQAGDDVITAVQWSANTHYGGAGHDTLSGAVWQDNLYGGSGHDVLDGKGGGDYLYGHGGHDLLRGGAEGDVVDGGAGDDTVSYSDSRSGVILSLRGGWGFGGDADGDTIADVEHAEGSWRADVIMGADGDNHIKGLNGDDYLNAQGGDDRLSGGFGADTLVGGAGFDTADYSDTWGGGVQVHLGHGTGQGRSAQGDVLWGIEGVVGTYSADTLVGSADGNHMDGGAGHDRMWGGHGADTLDGGTGHDGMAGGHGDDVIFGGYGDDYLAGGASGADALDGGAGHDILIGGTGADTLDGGMGDDRLQGGAGADVLAGGAGQDTADYRGSSDGVFISMRGGKGWGGDADGDTLTSIEHVVGSNFDDVLMGGTGTNALSGGGGDDYLNAQGGDDTLAGGAGDDILVAGSGTVVMAGGAGNDTYRAFADQTTIRIEGANGGPDADVAHGFDLGTDKVDIAGLALGDTATAAAWLTSHAQIDGADLFLDIGDGRSLRLLDVVDDSPATPNTASASVDDFTMIF